MKLRTTQAAPPTDARRRAFTLIEAVISTALLGLVVVAALTTVGATARTRQVVVNSSHGHALAQDLMAEILEQPYGDPEAPEGPKGRDVNEDPFNRKTWDDVDDWDGWNKNPPKSRDGADMDEFGGWTRSVTVDYVQAANPKAISGTDQGLKRITVSVTDPLGKTTVLRALRSRAGIPDWPPEFEITYASGVSVDVRMQQAGLARLISGAPLLNQPDSSGINLFFNGNAELGAVGWEGFGCDVSEYNADTHGGDAAILVWSRPNEWNGGGQRIRDVLESGATYDVEAWIVHQFALPKQFFYRLTLVTLEGGEQSTTFGHGIANPSNWKRLSAQFVPNWTGTLVDAYIEIEATSLKDPYVIDDAVLRKVQ